MIDIVFINWVKNGIPCLTMLSKHLEQLDHSKLMISKSSTFYDPNIHTRESLHQS